MGQEGGDADRQAIGHWHGLEWHVQWHVRPTGAYALQPPPRACHAQPRRAPAAGFSPLRAASHRGPRHSRSPGPGHYDGADDTHTLSRVARSPAAVFGTAPRLAPDSPTRDGAPGEAAAAVAWLERDAAAALDFTRPRAPTAVIAPAPVPRDADGDGDGPTASPPRPALDVSYRLVEARVRGTPVMRTPTIRPSENEGGGAVVYDEHGQPLERMPLRPEDLADPWGIDAATRPRRPAWGFPSVGHGELTPVRPCAGARVLVSTLCLCATQ